jgi:hypothetical protein
MGWEGGYTNRQLKTCEKLTKKFLDFKPHPGHEVFVAALKLRHGHKSGFWNA